MKIYRIKDPYTFKTAYIGKTSRELYVRLIEHCHEVHHRERKFCTLKRDWFDRFIRNGILPIIELIEECPDSEAGLREKMWIEKETPILNIVFANNGDLIAALVNSRRIPIFQYSIYGEFIKEWSSIAEASLALKVENANICYAANGKRKSAGQWMWRYYKEDSIPPYHRNAFKKPVYKYNMQGEFIAAYDCARSVEGVAYKLISKCCRKVLYSVYGFRYSFEKFDKLPPIKYKNSKKVPDINQDIVRTSEKSE